MGRSLQRHLVKRVTIVQSQRTAPSALETKAKALLETRVQTHVCISSYFIPSTQRARRHKGRGVDSRVAVISYWQASPGSSVLAKTLSKI